MDLVQLESLKTQLTQYLLDSISNERFELSACVISMIKIVANDIKEKKED